MTATRKMVNLGLVAAMLVVLITIGRQASAQNEAAGKALSTSRALAESPVPPAPAVEGVNHVLLRLPPGATLESTLEPRTRFKGDGPPQPSLFHRIFDSRQVPRSAPTGEMPGSFEGHTENLGEYIPQTAGNIWSGLKDIYHGNFAKGGTLAGACMALLLLRSRRRVQPLQMN